MLFTHLLTIIMLLPILFSTMISSTFLFNRDSAIVKQDLPLKDGPCPTPKPIENFNPKQFHRYWIVLYTQNPTVKNRTCTTEPASYRPTSKSLWIVVRYDQPKGKRGKEEIYQAEPVPAKSAVYKVYAKMADGTWSKTYWTYTIIGDIPATATTRKAYLEYACTAIGDKHYGYSKIISVANKMPDEDFQKLKAIAIKNGFKKDFIQVDQKDCKNQ